MGSSVPEEVRGVRTHPSPNIKCPLLQSFFMTSYSKQSQNLFHFITSSLKPVNLVLVDCAYLFTFSLF